ncbi:MAG: hypothetical protein ACQERN_04835 [Thermodesulfobacteriota bacterium]
MKHWGVIGLLVVFLIFGVLFYGYIDAFKQIYINGLKGLYPEIYIETQGERVNALMPGIAFEKEIFQISQVFKFRFAPDTTDILLFDVGIRASSPERLPGIVNKAEADNNAVNTVWVNRSLWQKLARSTSFDGEGIYLKGRGGRYKYLKVDRFHLLGQNDKDWLVLSTPMAKDLGMLFNIAAIYPGKNADQQSIESTYAAEGYKVFRWSDRLPFLNIAMYRVGLQLYAVFIAATVFLIAFLVLSVFHDMLIEFKKVIQFSMIYGLNEFLILLVFVLFASVYALGCFFLAGAALSGVKAGFSDVFPMLDTIPAVRFLLYAAVILLPILIVLNAVAVIRVRKEGYVSLEE